MDYSKSFFSFFLNIHSAQEQKAFVCFVFPFLGDNNVAGEIPRHVFQRTLLTLADYDGYF